MTDTKLAPVFPTPEDVAGWREAQTPELLADESAWVEAWNTEVASIGRLTERNIDRWRAHYGIGPAEPAPVFPLAADYDRLTDALRDVLPADPYAGACRLIDSCLANGHVNAEFVETFRSVDLAALATWAREQIATPDTEETDR